MKSLVYPLLFSLLLFFAACTGEDNEKSGKGNQELSFTVADSLAIEYIGNLLLMDVSPKEEYFALRDWNRNLFIIANKQGEILYEWTKDQESPEGHGRTVAGPMFVDDERLLIVGSFGYFIYDLKGNIQEHYKEAEWPSGLEMGFFGPKRYHAFDLDGKLRLLGPNFIGNFMPHPNPESFKSIFFAKPEFNGPLQQPDFEVPTEGLFANMKINPAFTYHIPFPKESIHYTAFEYYKAQAPSGLSVNGRELAVMYSKDPTVYFYEISDQGFTLTHTIPLQPDELYIDDPAVSTQPIEIKTADGSRSVRTPGGMGDGFLMYVHSYENQLITSYSSGVKPELRVQPTLNVNASGGLSINTDGMPRSKMLYQLFIDGKKVGKDIPAPSKFLNLAVVKDGYLWFARNATGDEEESDFVTFYKTKLE
jgi:hypothetical protein